MGRTTFEEIWDEYATLGGIEKPQFLFDASITLKEQGNETAQRAVLYQAIEDAFETGDSLTAARASEELSRLLVASGETAEAIEVGVGVADRFPPWQSFEMGIVYRSLAWAYKVMEANVGYEECLKVAISQFESSGYFEWAYPLRNELGEVLLSREDWSALAVVLSAGEARDEEFVAPIAYAVRGYLLGRLAIHQLNPLVATRQLIASVVGLEREHHRLQFEAMDSLSWAIQLSGMDVSTVLDAYDSEFTFQPEVRIRLFDRLSRASRLFL